MKYPTFVTVAFTITSEQAEWLAKEALNTQGFNKSELVRKAIKLLREKRGEPYPDVEINPDSGKEIV